MLQTPETAECARSMHGSVAVSAAGETPVMCGCPPATEPININTGERVFRELEAWSPQDGVGSVCKASCILAVYHALLTRTISPEEARFPNALIDAQSLWCLLSEGGQAADLMGPMIARGVTENVIWVDTHGEPVLKDVTFTENTEVWSLGDLHGRLGSLRKFVARWLESGMEAYVVALGDMIDRGNRQLEVAAALIAWRAMFPHKVSILRGNHEAWEIMSVYGFQCIENQGDLEGDPGRVSSPQRQVYPNDHFFEPFLKFFGLLPTALRVVQPLKHATGVYMHGGFAQAVMRSVEADATGPDKAKVFQATFRRDVPDDEIIELTWSESHHRCRGDAAGCQQLVQEKQSPRYLFNAARNRGFLRNEAATRRFLNLMQACIMTTGHTHYSMLYNINQQAKLPQGRTPCLVEVREGDTQFNGTGASTLTRGMTHQMVLSAHNFHRSECRSDDDVARLKTIPALWGFFGRVSFPQSGNVLVEQRRVFDPEAYDEVSLMLDVGVMGGQYPMRPSCDYFAPDPSSPDAQFYRCESGGTCPGQAEACGRSM